MEIYDTGGRRLYLTSDERRAFLEAATKAPREVWTFCHVLHFTGCRIFEALTLTPKCIDIEGKCLVFETLKKRRSGVFRAVPVPPQLLRDLELAHGLKEARRRAATVRLWPWSRMTPWRRVSAVMEATGIAEGPHRCPKGLHHGYGVHAISKGIPLNLLSNWMGHSSLEVTAIYANALGEEQQAIAARMWT